jgi:hypothetical protein
MTYGHQPLVPLMTLSVRTSGKGRDYMVGWLGQAKVLAFAGEPDKFGNATWDVSLAQPEPRQGAGARGRPHRRGGRQQQQQAAAEASPAPRHDEPEELDDESPF